MTNGQITLNGITDAQLILILKEKETLKGFGFEVHPLQRVAIVNTGPNRPQESGYNNAIFIWQNDAGLKEVMAVVGKLHHQQEHHHA